jgi:hypothetical protein
MMAFADELAVGPPLKAHATLIGSAPALMSSAMRHVVLMLFSVIALTIAIITIAQMVQMRK